MKSAGADFKVQGRGQHATLIGPVLVQCAYEILKIHDRSISKAGKIPSITISIGAMPNLAIIKTGNTLSPIHERFGDFDRWFIRSMGTDRFDYRVVNVHEDQPLPDDADAVLVTGSPAMVSHRHAWSEKAADWLADFHRAGRPMLGVCYGHQLIAHALGGKVGPNPLGRRMGTRRVEITAEDDALLGPFFPEQDFQVTHVEVVLEPPPRARVIARTDGDDHHALHFGRRSWGVQFHPEFNVEIMHAYIRSRASVLAGEGIEADHLLEQMRPAPAGDRVMNRFADLVDQAGSSDPKDSP